MKLIKKSKIIIFLFASCAFTPLAFAGRGGSSGNKPEKVEKYKTSQTVAFINSTINYLNTKNGSNKRHLKSFLKCKRIFDSGKKTIRGSEILDLKKCNNLMNHKDYAPQKIASMSNQKINIDIINEVNNSVEGELKPNIKNENLVFKQN